MSWALDWAEILLPDKSLEVFVRGTLIYFGLLVLLRIILKRQAGSVSESDVLVTVLVADAVQNGMAGGYKSVPDGLLLVATIVGWNYAVDWLSFRFRFIDRLLNQPPLPLVLKGKLQRRNMRKEFITEDELWIKLRENDVSDLEQVKGAYLESDGEISVVKDADLGSSI